MQTGRVSDLQSDSGVRRSLKADAALLASEVRYRSLFECAPDGILIADPDGRYIDANKTMCALLGYSHDELVGLHSADLVCSAEAPNVAEALDPMVGPADQQREWEFRRQGRDDLLRRRHGD